MHQRTPRYAPWLSLLLIIVSRCCGLSPQQYYRDRRQPPLLPTFYGNSLPALPPGRNGGALSQQQRRPTRPRRPNNKARRYQQQQQQQRWSPTPRARHDAFGNLQPFQVKQISSSPQLLILQNFVSPQERAELMGEALQQPSLNYNEKSNRNRSRVTWVPHDHPISQSLARSAGRLLLGVERAEFHEQLQVVQYRPNGEFRLHHDEYERTMTVLYYLNGVAGTWFPLAGGQTQNSRPPQSEAEAWEAVARNGLQPGRDGILVGDQVPIRPGDALVFYNYLGPNQPDWRTFHAGLPAQQEKWIATHWFRDQPSSQARAL